MNNDIDPITKIKLTKFIQSMDKLAKRGAWKDVKERSIVLYKALSNLGVE